MPTLTVHTVLAASPQVCFDLVGVIADKLLIERHMRNFLIERNRHLERIALELGS